MEDFSASGVTDFLLLLFFILFLFSKELQINKNALVRKNALSSALASQKITFNLFLYFNYNFNSFFL